MEALRGFRACLGSGGVRGASPQLRPTRATRERFQPLSQGTANGRSSSSCGCSTSVRKPGASTSCASRAPMASGASMFQAPRTSPYSARSSSAKCGGRLRGGVCSAGLTARRSTGNVGYAPRRRQLIRHRKLPGARSRRGTARPASITSTDGSGVVRQEGHHIARQNERDILLGDMDSFHAFPGPLPASLILLVAEERAALPQHLAPRGVSEHQIHRLGLAPHFTRRMNSRASAGTWM